MYQITDLGNHRLPYAINNRRWVCGVYAPGWYEAFAWHATTGFVDLAPTAYRSLASAINEGGQIAGQINEGINSGRRPFRWTPGTPGTLEILATPAGFNDAVAFAIDTQGRCAGVMEPVTFPPGHHGTLWPSPASQVGIGLDVARGMNDYGQVVGEAPGPRLWNAGFWQPTAPGATTGTTHLINLPGGATLGETVSINQSGQIAGTAWGFPATPYVLDQEAYLWAPDSPNGITGSALLLGKLPNNDPTRSSTSEAHDINRHGVVVGESNGRAFIYHRGRMDDLNDFIPPNSGWVLAQARGINDGGSIVGTGWRGYEYHGFVLRPTIPWDELLKIPPSPWAEWMRRRFPVPPEPPAGAPPLPAFRSLSPAARELMELLAASDAAASSPDPERCRGVQSAALKSARRMIDRMLREAKRE